MVFAAEAGSAEALKALVEGGAKVNVKAADGTTVALAAYFVYRMLYPEAFAAASNRLDVVLEVIEEASHKVLVFVPFTHTIKLLNDFLTKHGVTCAVINGEVNVNKRSEIVDHFQTLKDPHVLLIQPQAASHGLTLTAADTIIWYAPVTSVETYLQANARIDRPGQKNAMTIVHIKGSKVEDRMYKLLRSNISNHNQIIDLYRETLDEKDFEIA